jgi:sterol 3beta-glucosyltransferase
MGASALMSALNALPWEEDEDNGSSDEASSEDEEEHHPHDDRHSAGAAGAEGSRPKSEPACPISLRRCIDLAVSRLHSSLQTIRTAHTQDQDVQVAFRRPSSEERSELSEEGKPAIVAEVLSSDSRRSSLQSDGSMPAGTRVFLDDQFTREERKASEEEDSEMARAGLETGGSAGDNTDATLRQDGMKDKGAGEKQRIRREKLGQKLMEVFGLHEREEVIEEMRCWLLRSISESSWARYGTAELKLFQCSRGTCISLLAISASLRTCRSERQVYI